MTDNISFPHHLVEFSILVVEDDEITRRIILRLLKELRFHRVSIAKDGAIALALLNEGRIRPDIILCDWLMPNMDGLQFLHVVRKAAYHAKFIMVTATDTIEAAMLAKAHGADGYLIKPVTKNKLEESIFAVVGKY